MCGIVGFVGQSNSTVLRAMALRLAHRGPDGEGLLENAMDGVHLGHRRLAVIDLAGGHQPMLTSNGALSIVFNGEIYNFRELRAELEEEGARFVSDHSDTEVLLHGWLLWGAEMFSRLNGMWALAIHDRERRELILARDRFGKKPLFYYSGKDEFVFASELSALRLHPAVPSDRSDLALQKYFAYGYIPAPLTLLSNVYKLQAGHLIRLNLVNRKLQLEKFWQYEPAPHLYSRSQTEESIAEELLEKLASAVNRRLISDVPVGCFLSGGLDSSTIAALALRSVGTERLKTFSIAMDDATFDESQFAHQVARHIGAEHYVEKCTVDSLRQHLPKILAKLDEPIADASILPTYMLCSFARRHVTVALGGDGADELLAGYDPFRALRLARAYRRWTPSSVQLAVEAVVQRLPVSHRYMSFDFKLKRALYGAKFPPNLWLPTWMSPLKPDEISELLQQPVDVESLYSEAIQAWERSSGCDDIDRSSCFFVDMYLQNNILAKVDRASMLNSLEVRSPFLDIEVVDFLRQLPSNFKLRGSISKWILKIAARSLLPESIINRRKQGFAVPTGRWFETGELGASAPANNSVFFTEKLRQHRQGRLDNHLYLWSQLVLDEQRQDLQTL